MRLGRIPHRGYGVVLVLILVSLALSMAQGPTGAWDVAAAIVRGATLIAVLATAGWGRRATSGVSAMVVVALVVMIVWTVVADGRGLSAALEGVLVAAAAVVIARDIGTDPVVNRQTVLGAASIYLLLGLFFASVLGLVAVVDSQSLFDSGDGSRADQLYFSLITLTTVGFGDFVPASGIARALAATEALIGQLYLVTVLALVVSRVGQPRRQRRPPRT